MLLAWLRIRDPVGRMIYDLCEIGYRAQKQGLDPISVFRAAATLSIEDHNRKHRPNEEVAPIHNEGDTHNG